MFKSNPETEKELRSLLQKAVRRGNVDITKRILIYLVKNNDFDWVRKRLAAITFEECWPFALNVSYEKDPDLIIRHYLNLTCSVKNKDAAGLGSFACEYGSRDKYMLEILDKEELKKVKIVAAALENQENFWEWAENETENDERKAGLITKARESAKKVSWPWDKAFILAGAYLAVTEPVPVVKYRKSEVELPLWAGIDKHTPFGKMAIRKAAFEKGVVEEKALALSFYFEGAVINNINEASGWWAKEVLWKMKKLNLTVEQGAEIWYSLRDKVAAILNRECIKLQAKLDSVDINEQFSINNTQQMGLF